MEKQALNEEVSITKVTVKKEENIKEFAETAMNELLGWYGYDTTKKEVKDNCRSYSGSNDSEGESSVRFTEGCGWCGKPVEENNGLISAASVFCSELCFSQSRRANFKRNKTCDWCRHVRHTVSYVDFQDGASQLQFCSDKCLNQYKMHIFCRETRAHLELHPHLHGEESTGSNLITPDLWLKPCKSPVCSSPPKPSPTSPKPAETTTKVLPSISIAPSSKLLNSEVNKSRIRPPKRLRKRYPSTITSNEALNTFNDSPQDLRVRHTPPVEEVEEVDSKIEDKSVLDNAESRTSPDGATKISPSYLKAILGNLLPPPSVFVPYPVILPLPIPIPIPIPIPKMFKSTNDKNLIELKEISTQTDVMDKSNSEKEVENVLEVKPNETVVRRPLRKRKKITETKNKTITKHKKTFSTNI
ncbi:sine oculis-binding protein homolog B isoform X2 [Sitophilus oryzae]|uniref:Sine oculis-binding protein homolog B isoform X1 n=1 Tax=Sitophilus oryzae TaxID=7048 RepID=A0A6J2Y217_SITOR|nr:sine oculis-binding protein homolog B isoform X1 [Sitophilus oryzae]XP_030757848.1 sine oculis-binding protein homolog B isoform X2 [Sitophilus oryzae]